MEEKAMIEHLDESKPSTAEIVETVREGDPYNLSLI